MAKLTKAVNVPTEDEEQATVIEWAELNAVHFPDLKLLYAIPNGGKRDVREAAKFKRTGVKPGVPDLHLPVPKGGYHGLYIEMKRKKDGKLSPDQREWLRILTEQGHYCAVCKGWEQAVKTIINYLRERLIKDEWTI